MRQSQADYMVNTQQLDLHCQTEGNQRSVDGCRRGLVHEEVEGLQLRLQGSMSVFLQLEA
jgi:hypothetical protein